ncbi:hypothetical protein [Mycobacterium heckeshornense]|uniref:Uncharacterized protein n=1 Tax=Mycobacterium heckeshornense TaxID=110505 RepID=A0A7R7GWB2_9MYCO|nr:hypothetical protein [Mycobacterium heckeshornense]BCO37270.1 hypothetical protein MHEC_37030 [Mycobacterium heckeshornense]
MSLNTSTNPRTRAGRVAAGAGLVLATAGVIAFGSGVAAASPPPMLVDDPAPAPAPDPTAAVNAANAIFGVLNSLLNSVLPGAGSLVPETSPPAPCRQASAPPRQPPVARHRHLPQPPVAGRRHLPRHAVAGRRHLPRPAIPGAGPYRAATNRPALPGADQPGGIARLRPGPTP